MHTYSFKMFYAWLSYYTIDTGGSFSLKDKDSKYELATTHWMKYMAPALLCNSAFKYGDANFVKCKSVTIFNSESQFLRFQQFLRYYPKWCLLVLFFAI